MTGEQRKKAQVESDAKNLRDIFIYLCGLKLGKGHLAPLGDNHLDTLYRKFSETK